AIALTLSFVMPAANHAYRVRRAGHFVSLGIDELGPLRLRRQALWLKESGHPRIAAQLLVTFHLRWALAGAAVGFALLALGLNERRISMPGLVLAVVTAVGGYVIYLVMLNRLHSPVLSDEGTAMTIVWLPNIVLLVAGGLLCTGRRFPTP